MTPLTSDCDSRVGWYFTEAVADTTGIFTAVVNHCPRYKQGARRQGRIPIFNYVVFTTSLQLLSQILRKNRLKQYKNINGFNHKLVTRRRIRHVQYFWTTLFVYCFLFSLVRIFTPRLWIIILWIIIVSTHTRDIL